MTSAADRLLLWSLRLTAVLACSIVVWILAFLLGEALPALGALGPLRWLGDPSWHPTVGATEGHFGLAPMLLATAASSAGAVLLATPVALGSALFCHSYGPPRWSGVYRRLVQLLAGIPSVVFGFWGLVELTPRIARWQPPGQSLLAGILILALMILPTVSLLMESALVELPASYRQAAAALGLSPWASLRRVLLPAAAPGLASAVLLGSARAIGETMAVLMVSGNVVQLPGSLFAPVRTLTANIALELGYALDLHRSALFVGGLVLLVLVAALVAVAEGLAATSLAGGRAHG
jgi:phosphate transport system permease protein